jgi:hypothetical protein
MAGSGGMGKRSLCHRIVYGLWVASLLTGVASLFLYRSSEAHGPDMVGSELSSFLIPVAISAVAAIAMRCCASSETQEKALIAPQRAFGISLLIGVVGVAIYAAIIMR